MLLFAEGAINGCADTYRSGGDDLHTLLLNPVPEPSSLLALGSGILALGGLIRRRKV